IASTFWVGKLPPRGRTVLLSTSNRAEASLRLVPILNLAFPWYWMFELTSTSRLPVFNTPFTVSTLPSQLIDPLASPHEPVLLGGSCTLPPETSHGHAAAVIVNAGTSFGKFSCSTGRPMS